MLFKVILVGNGDVGKSRILSRYADPEASATLVIGEYRDHVHDQHAYRLCSLFRITPSCRIKILIV